MCIDFFYKASFLNKYNSKIYFDTVHTNIFENIKKYIGTHLVDCKNVKSCNNLKKIFVNNISLFYFKTFGKSKQNKAFFQIQMSKITYLNIIIVTLDQTFKKYAVPKNKQFKN